MAEASNNKKRVIRASEIGQYAYCARAWWLGSVLGIPSSNTSAIAHGDAHHHTHGQRVHAVSRLRWLALGLILLAALVFALSIVI